MTALYNTASYMRIIQQDGFFDEDGVVIYERPACGDIETIHIRGYERSFFSDISYHFCISYSIIFLELAQARLVAQNVWREWMQRETVGLGVRGGR